MLEQNFYSPADLFCSHVEQDVGRCEAKCHTINQQGAGVRGQGDALQATKHHHGLAVRASLTG